ncbi:MAG: zinc-ribbon domain-containing protein [Rectinemataceae bacterium]|jgi:hypothetical protein
MNVRFCPNCRSLILTDFLYCPYCGAAAVKGPELSEALAEPFEKLGGPPPSGATDPFAGAERSLERLESDMDLILERLGKEGRSAT